VDREQLVEAHPVLFHVAGDGAWPSIQEHGLLSTAALVDLYGPPPETRLQLLNSIRLQSVALQRDGLRPVIVRDQGPLRLLPRCLADDTTVQQFLDVLNDRVFFWLSRERLLGLVSAYRKHPQTVLSFSTAEVLEAYGERVGLAAYNTGSIRSTTSPRRSRHFFQSVGDYPYDAWRKKRGRRMDPVVEFTVEHSVPDAAMLATRVERWVDGAPAEVLYEH
jgi:hypothetical protein